MSEIFGGGIGIMYLLHVEMSRLVEHDARAFLESKR